MLKTPRKLRATLCLMIATTICVVGNQYGFAQDPFNSPAAAKPATPIQESSIEIIRGDAIVIQAIRESNPTTALELLQAIEATLNLQAYAECKKYLTQLIQKKAPPAELAQANSITGTALLIRLSRLPELQPEGKAVADTVLKAASDLARDSKRIDALVKQLNADDPAKRQQAVNDLKLVGVDAAVPMLKILSQDSLAQEHQLVQGAMVLLFEQMRGPVVAALQSDKATLRRNVIEVLGQSGTKAGLYQMLKVALESGAEADLAREAIRRMVGADPQRREVELVLQREIKELLAGFWPEPRELGGLVIVWEWDNQANAPRKRMMPPDDAALQMASILAQDLAAIDPNNSVFTRLALMTKLEWEQRSVGWSKPLAPAVMQELQKTPQPLLLTVLDDAVQQEQTGAVIAALHILALTGDASLLQADGRESLVASLISHTDRRIRLAAVQAVVNWEPMLSFNGASRMAESLGFFLSGTGTPKVLIGDVRPDHAQTLVGLMGGVGYEGEAFLIPRELFNAATTNADYELVLLSDAIDHPRVPELIQWLRRDYRSQHLLIGVMGRADTFTYFEKLLRDEPRVDVIPRLHADQPVPLYDVNAEDVELAKARAVEEFGSTTRLPEVSTAGRMILLLRAQEGRDFVPAEERLAQAFIAADLLAQLMSLKGSALRDDMGRLEQQLVDNLFRPELTSRLAPIVAQIGSAKVQSALVDLASQQTFPLEARQAASQAFARAVEKRGTLLTTGQITHQYDRYNASETADVATQQVLSGLLDVIEARALKSQANAR